MKARSVVFTHIQWPFDVFGLPPKLMALSLTAGLVAFVLCLVSGALPLSVIVMVLTDIVSLGLSYRLARKDKHIENVFLTSLTFWGFSPRRWLLASAPSQRSGGPL